MKFNIKYFTIFLFLIIIIILSYRLYQLEYNNYSNYKNYNKKIAFCFLIYDKINNEELWYKYFNNIDKNKYNIYIHYKEDKPLKYFEDYKIDKSKIIETCHCCISIALVQTLLLEESLKDKKNEHFIWLSQACIPIKSFDYIYNNLKLNKSYLNIAPDVQTDGIVNDLIKYTKRENIKKAAMPAVLCKKHSKIIVSKKDLIKKWFENVSICKEEVVYPTLLHHFNEKDNIISTPNLSSDAVIFTGWPDMTNYKNFDKSKLTNNQPNAYSHICEEELDFLIKSKSLFARKFDDNCGGLEKLITKISQH